ncbi:MAG: ACT domain-containing protein [Candidatus Dormibacteria bacterium]
MNVKSEANLDVLLAELSPRRRPGQYVFVAADETKPVADSAVLASVVEPEGLSLVMTRRDAERAGLPYDFVAGWVTLEARSALDAVGLTAAVAVALSEAGISCNILAGYHHDHLLVPYERVEEAIDTLLKLSAHHHSGFAARPTVRRASVEDAPVTCAGGWAECAPANKVGLFASEPAPVRAPGPGSLASSSRDECGHTPPD